MRLTLFFVALTLALTGSVHAADSHEHEHRHAHDHHALHGGVVVEADHLDFELVAWPDRITLYVRDHDQPVQTQGGKARLTLLGKDGRTEVTLEPAGENRLETQGSFTVPRGTKAAALVTLPGRKSANVRFVIK